MTTKISAWGNSLGLRLPKTLTSQLGLLDGSEVQLSLEGNGKIVIEPISPTVSLKDLLKTIQPSQVHPEYWTDRPQGKEAW